MSNRHSLPREHRARDIRKESKQAMGTHSLESTEGNKSGHQKKVNEKTGCTYILGSAEAGTSHDTERQRASEGHSQTAEYQGRDKSGPVKVSESAKVTHFLESTNGGTSPSQR